MITSQVVQGVKLYSLGPVMFNNWAVKASTTDEGIICLVLFNTLTYDSIVKYFEDEDKAFYYLHHEVT